MNSNALLDTVGLILGGIVILAILGRILPVFGFANRFFSSVSRMVGSTFKGMIPARGDNESSGEMITRMGGTLLSIGLVFLFILPFALGVKWGLSFFIDTSMSLGGPDRFLNLGYSMLAVFLVGLITAYGRGSETITFLAASYNTGAAMLLWDQTPMVSLSAGLLAVATFGITWCAAGTTKKTRVHSNENNADDSKADRSNKIINRAVKPRYNFTHVAGMSELKTEMLKAGKAITQSRSDKNGVLLHGAPGNGKTFFAEALAGELRLPFINVSFGNIASQWVGQTTVNAMKVFDDAVAQAPCVLFMDEIDSVFIDRTKVANTDSEAPKTLNAILTRLVDVRGKGVVVVGATNFLDRLDAASIREGRFDFKVEVPTPDYDARLSLLKSGLKKVSVDQATIESVSRRWEGFSVSRIRSIADKAVDVAAEVKQTVLTFEDLMAALRKIQGSKGDRLPENVPGVDDLFLSDEMRKRLNNILVRMKNIEDVERFGGNAPAGILFSGPPGTGKSLGAMSLAKSSEWAFIRTSGNELLENPETIDKIAARASDIRPCIIFIDEADDVLADRKMSPMSKSVTNRLLAVMDGAGGRAKDVVFIAATNHPEMLDPAMLRGGRFTEKIEFMLPSDKVIRDYVAKWISKSKAPLSSDFNVENVTGLLSGQSLANAKDMLQGAINESIVRISGNPNEKVRLQDLKDAIELISTE